MINIIELGSHNEMENRDSCIVFSLDQNKVEKKVDKVSECGNWDNLFGPAPYWACENHTIK